LGRKTLRIGQGAENVRLIRAGYAVISRAFAYGGRTPQFEAASGVLIIIIIVPALRLAYPSPGRHAVIPCPLTTFALSPLGTIICQMSLDYKEGDNTFTGKIVSETIAQK
jgi:hypothetical protein